MGDESPCIPAWRHLFPSDQQNVIRWLEGFSQRWQCFCWLLSETARVCVCARKREAPISSPLWKMLGALGSNDSGSPQHLATVLHVCMYVCGCVVCVRA